MILIFTHSSDLGADLVISHLHQLNAPYLRIDTDSLGTHNAHFGFESNSPVLTYADMTIKPSDVTALWARRFARPKILDSVDPQYGMFTLRELSLIMEAFIDRVNGLQVNPYEADRKSGNRLYQCQLAQEVGFLVPKTLVTQRPEKAAAFARQNDPVISKAISFGVLDGSGKQVAYTSAVHGNVDFAGVFSCPTLFQERVPKKQEWRVTTVGTRHFSAKTCSDVMVDNVDWRRTSDIRSVFAAAELPRSVKRMLSALCSRAGLLFATHDIIETPGGDFFFLETNPAGQWGWLELELDLPVGKALASLLSEAR